MTCRKLALAILLLPSLVHAQAFRVGTGIQIVPRSSAPSKVAANGVLWIDSTASNVLKYCNPASSCITLGSGGGGTGNWTFSGNNADLTGAAAMGIGPTTATSVVLGASTIPTTISGTVTFAKGATASGSTSFDLSGSSATWKPPTGGIGSSLLASADATQNIGASSTRFATVFALNHDSGTSNLLLKANGNTRVTITDTSSHTLTSGMADGASAVGTILDTTSAWSNATAKIASFRNNAVEKLAVLQDGTLTNGVSVTLKSTAADGAGAVGTIADTSTAWINAGAKLLSVRTNGSEKLYVKATGDLYSPRSISTSSAPSFTSGTLIGTATGVTVTGTDEVGEIVFTTGTVGTVPNDVFTITYSRACPTGSAVSLYPSDDNAAAVFNYFNNSQSRKTTANANGWTLRATAGNTVYTNTTQYKFMYVAKCY